MVKKFSKEEKKNVLRDYFEHDLEGGRTGFYFLKEEKELSKMGIGKFSSKPGTIYLLILPRVEDPKFFKVIWVHYRIGVDKRAFLCPRKMYGENCPICDYGQELVDNGEEDSDILKTYWPVKRILLWVVDMQNKKTADEGACIYDAPKTILEGIAGVTRNERSGEIIDISDYDEGKSLIFKRSGEGGYTRYDSFNLEDRQFDIPKKFFDVPNMRDVLVEPDISEMKKALGIDVGGYAVEEENNGNEGSFDTEKDDNFDDSKNVDDEPVERTRRVPREEKTIDESEKFERKRRVRDAVDHSLRRGRNN